MVGNENNQQSMFSFISMEKRIPKLCYSGHALMENRNGLVVDTALTTAIGRGDVVQLLEIIGRGERI
ncbi:MAG: hypothetical protein KQI78_06730 [Deltaproteobacteria bacterium]|jgi:hypothetical protein|nr:hypothetical protein [Deltaproteobacteria bacterium]